MTEDQNLFDGQDGFREWAEVQVEQASHFHKLFLEQHAALYRWILAARLSVNGGAAVALISSEEIWVTTLTLAMVCFVLGILLAILAAEIDQSALETGIAPNLAHLGFWVKARATNQFDADQMDELLALPKETKIRQRRGKIIGWASLAMFTIGATLVGMEHADLSFSAVSCAETKGT